MLYISGKMFRFVGNEIRLSLSRISYKTSAWCWQEDRAALSFVSQKRVLLFRR